VTRCDGERGPASRAAGGARCSRPRRQPPTRFLDSAAKLVHLHAGQYEAQVTLDHDIEGFPPGD